MLIDTEAICLQQYRYTDNSIIVHLYTAEKGKIPLIIQGARSRKSKSKAVLFQPLNILDVSIDYKEKREVQRLKEARIAFPLNDIGENIHKKSIALFLAEVLHKTLKTEVADPELFQFLIKSISFFDAMHNSYAYFHLLFLIKLSRKLGFLPGNQRSPRNKIFHLDAGLFVSDTEKDASCLNAVDSAHLDSILRLDYVSLDALKLSRQQRTRLLFNLILYFQAHIPAFGSLKSYDVLKTLYQ